MEPCSTQLTVEHGASIRSSDTQCKSSEMITHGLCGYSGVMTSWCFCNSSCGWVPLIPWMLKANMPMTMWFLDIAHYADASRWSQSVLGDVHYHDVIMGTIASQITNLTVVYSTVYSDADQRKHQSSASLAFVWEIHRDRWIPAQRASYAENVSIWWRHHVSTIQLLCVAHWNVWRHLQSFLCRWWWWGPSKLFFVGMEFFLQCPAYKWLQTFRCIF